MRIETGREIIIPPSVAERAGVPETWRVAMVPQRDARKPAPRDFGLVPRQRTRGRIIDILV